MKLTQSRLKLLITEAVNEALSRREAEILAFVTPYVQGLLARLESALATGRISRDTYDQEIDSAMADATEANLERGKYDSIDDYILSHCAGFEKYKERPDWFGPLKAYLDDEDVALGDEAQSCLVHYMKPMKVTLGEGTLQQMIIEELENVLGESDYLSNIYKWCPAATKCAPGKQKTKWWKGR
jgi:hypothetical protein